MRRYAYNLVVLVTGNAHPRLQRLVNNHCIVAVAFLPASRAGTLGRICLLRREKRPESMCLLNRNLFDLNI